MANFPYYVHINMNGNEMQNVALERLAAHPSVAEARIYYNNVDKTVYFYDGTGWVDIGGDIKDIAVAGGLLSVTEVNGVYTITLNANSINHSAINQDEPEKHRIINDASNGTTDLFSASKILALFTAASSAGEWLDSVNAVIANNTLAPPTEVLNDRYLLSSGGGTPHANWDGAVAGQVVQFNGTVWVKTTPTIGTYVASDADITGTWLYTGSVWIKQEWENTPDATEAIKGKIAIATAAEVLTGTETAKVVTPATLKTELDKKGTVKTLRGAIIWVVDAPGYKMDIDFSSIGTLEPVIKTYIAGVESKFSHTIVGTVVTIRSNQNPASSTYVIMSN